MRRVVLVFLASAVLTAGPVPAAKADTIHLILSGSSFSSNDTLHWGVLGNNVSVTNGTTAASGSGLDATINYALGGPGSTLVQCPGSTCSWNGNFAPGQTLLTTVNSTSGKGEGYLDLTFSKGIAGVGFQIEPNPNRNDLGKFQAEIFAYDGATLLGNWFLTGTATSDANNSANFLGLGDLTGTDITSIKIQTFNCAGGALPNCNDGFGINGLKLWEGSPYPGGTSTPEPASLVLLGSGLGALGFLRRKVTVRR